MHFTDPYWVCYVRHVLHPRDAIFVGGRIMPTPHRYAQNRWLCYHTWQKSTWSLSSGSRQGVSPGLTVGPNVNTGVLKSERGRKESKSQRGRGDGGSRGWSDETISKRMRAFSRSWKRQGTDSPQNLRKERSFTDCGCSPVRSIPDFWFLQLLRW